MQFEQERGRTASGNRMLHEAIRSVRRRSGCVEINKQAVNAWKGINEELMKCKDEQRHFL